MAPMKKRIEKEGGKRKEMNTVEVKNWSVSWSTARGYGDLIWGGGEKDGDIRLFKCN
jgi:hypothetical protein